MAVFEKPEIRELIEARDWTALRDIMSKWRIPDIADLISKLDKECRVLLFRSLPRSIAAEVFAEFESPDREALLRDLTDEETRQIIAGLKPDDRTAILEELPGQVTQRLLNLLSPEDLEKARFLLGYPEGSVGRLMTPDYVAVRPFWTVETAMEHIRRMGRQTETVNVVYVTDRLWHLVGAVSLRQLVLAQPTDLISSIMTTPAVSLSAFADREEALRTMNKYGLFVLPVVDSSGILVGLVTGDDILELATEEATEDFHKGAAVSPLRVGFGEATIGLLYKSRIGWLMTLIFMNLIAAGVIARYEHAISKVVALVFFMPLIIGCGGNAGAQAATLVVRDLATGDADYGDVFRLLLKELGVSLMLGLTISLVVWGPGVLQGGAAVGWVVALSGVTVVALSGVLGIATPMLLGRLGFDPATSSSPLITSLIDLLGVIVYFSIASRYLSI
ncbi:MAG TPA: magnesium transporter [Firmicutes bacterium]|nr:magnesium transporter [Candidatus Fermentithermobacillaceae bacterium]